MINSMYDKRYFLRVLKSKILQNKGNRGKNSVIT